MSQEKIKNSMNVDETVYVFGTSAWLALIEDEPGAEMVQDVLEKAASGIVEVSMSFMSFMEIFYIILQEREENAMKFHDRISVDPNVMLGKHVISQERNNEKIYGRH